MTANLNALLSTATDGQIQSPNNQNGMSEAVVASDVKPAWTVARFGTDGTLANQKSVNGPTVAIAHNGAGDYTATLSGTVPANAADLAVLATCNTAGLLVSVVITDATHLAIATKTDAGVATDSIVTLQVFNFAEHA